MFARFKNQEDSMISEIVARRKANCEFGCFEKYRKGTYKAKTIWYKK